MTVIPLESLPLGFRFRPTDEELVNHYLKRKITGEIRSEREVIPEIDVCKCEPWDLPVKALIRSEDPEWFFFAPKDRKYPNGSRSNRATEKGYWKATGKDRVIRSKGPTRQATMVGMKKTLVFHKGRAPRGERTHWIMHEYRTTEPEYDSGEQGGYVLYKLFRKADERAPGQTDEAELPNVDEVDRSGFSPAPSRSSPGETQQDGEISDEITAPVGRKSVLQESRSNLPNSVAGKTVGIQRWLEGTDCKPAKQDDNNSNSDIGLLPQKTYMGPPPDALLDQISNPQYEKSEYIFGPANQENHHLVVHSGNDNNQPDEGFLIDSFFADHVCSPDESTQQGNSADVAISDYLESPNQGVVNQDEVVWPDGMINVEELLMLDVPDFSTDDVMNGSQYENAALLPYESTDQDVYSVDSGADSLQPIFQDLFNSLEESSTQKNNLMTSNNTSALEATGITIMPRQPEPLFTHNVAPRRFEVGNQQNTNFLSSSYQINQISANDDTIEGTGIITRTRDGPYQRQSVQTSGISNHGNAQRRLCLQTRLDIGTMSCSPRGSVKQDETELSEQVDDENSDEFSAECGAASSDASSVCKLEELSVNDDSDAPKDKDTARLRKKTTGPVEAESVETKSIASRKRAPRMYSVSYLFWFVAAVILCIVMWSLRCSIVKRKNVGVQSYCLI
ncbi:uncharacterized protein LOC144567184 isoform X2 [Carex rostrata]